MSFSGQTTFFTYFSSLKKFHIGLSVTCCRYKPLGIMFIHWTFFLSSGPTQNENKVQKNFLYTVFELAVFGSARVWAWASDLGPDLRLGRWDLRLDPSRLATYLRLAYKDLELTCDLTLRDLQTSLITSSENFTRSRWGTHVVLIVLNTSIISPPYRLYFNVGKFRTCNRSLYGFLDVSGINLVALFCTRSNFSTSIFWPCWVLCLGLRVTSRCTFLTISSRFQLLTRRKRQSL